MITKIKILKYINHISISTEVSYMTFGNFTDPYSYYKCSGELRDIFIMTIQFNNNSVNFFSL